MRQEIKDKIQALISAKGPGVLSFFALYKKINGSIQDEFDAVIEALEVSEFGVPASDNEFYQVATMYFLYIDGYKQAVKEEHAEYMSVYG